MEYLREGREEDESKNQINKVTVNVGEAIAEIKSDESQRDYPESDAWDVIKQKSAKSDLGRAGDEGHKSSHRGDEARQGNGLCPVFFQKLFRSPNDPRMMGVIGKSLKKFFSQLSAKKITDAITDYRAGNQNNDGNRKMRKGTLGGEESNDEIDGIAGDEKSDH